MYSERRGNGQKPPQTKPSRLKTSDKTPGQKAPRTIEREFVQGAFVRVFYTRSTESEGSKMCDILVGGSRNV